MDLLGLSTGFVPVKYIQYLNLQWNREYYTSGTWEAQIPADEYDPSVRYAYCSDRPEVGIVEKIQTQDSADGHYIMLSGHFLEGALDWNIIPKENLADMKPEAIARQMVTSYPPDGLSLTVDQTGPVTDEDISQEWELAAVGTSMYDMLKTKELSQRITYNYQTGALKYAVWQGLDRTQEQSTNGWAIFSDESPFVTSMQITIDDSGYRNWAKVLYTGNAWKDVDQRQTGESKRITGVKAEKASADEAEEKGKEALEGAKIVYDASVKVIQKYFLYRTDYDLGDKCDIICHRLGMSWSARITGISEVFKQGRHEVTIEFGERTPTQFQKFSRLVRGLRS